MPGVDIVPFSRVQHDRLSRLLDEEEKDWIGELDWDYAPVRRILASFMRQNLLPGYVALQGRKAVAYTYFLINRSKGVIGTVYASDACTDDRTVPRLLDLAIGGLREARGVARIEAQIIPFRELPLTDAFLRWGFEHHSRHFLQLDLAHYHEEPSPASVQILPWDPAWLKRAASVTLESYRDETDSRICEDYGTLSGCESYLRSLMENPGCGFLLPEASFLAVDAEDRLCGFVLASRISSTSGMIPQIATLPGLQGQGLGRALMHATLDSLEACGVRTVSLTVTCENRRAFEWYQRLGFRTRKEFGAYVWNR